MKFLNKSLRPFLVLWSTQSLSALGSAMTSFALVIWSYEQRGSALSTALLTICSYAPYVLMSIFAGALSDRWNKKRTMIFCDAFAVLTTIAVMVLLKTGRLELHHLYLLNALNGLMNTLQQPASEVTVTLLTPKEHIQRVGGLRALSNALNTVLTPACATALLTLGGMDWVIGFDLLTCFLAIAALIFGVHIPHIEDEKPREPVLASARMGLKYLSENRLILDMILLLAGINLIASMFNAALPAMLLSRENGSEAVLGWVNTVTGLATLAGSLIASALPAPRNRVKVIHLSLLLSMSTENLLLALGRTPPVWCIAAVLGWIAIPLMNTNLDALFRTTIPVDMQGRVYSARNTLQFFTIPLGYLLGGWLVDRVCEPLMASLTQGHFLIRLLGSGKGTGAALLLLLIAGAGVGIVVASMVKQRKIIR
ncbi:MAG: MFS transporter [Clostridia bacterium]|nr:MFS transporter [Clostridia bacterium]